MGRFSTFSEIIKGSFDFLCRVFSPIYIGGGSSGVTCYCVENFVYVYIFLG